MTKKAHTIYLTVIALLLVGWLVPIGPSPAGVVRVGGKKVTILEKLPGSGREPSKTSAVRSSTRTTRVGFSDGTRTVNRT